MDGEEEDPEITFHPRLRTIRRNGGHATADVDQNSTRNLQRNIMEMTDDNNNGLFDIAANAGLAQVTIQ